ncbi:hypothetical protein AN958_09828 [Leucoagaricus sp. SymC.cos]|nr:hypothetical protein AN958_09828 [Leucoagaricus sp. SymC.cos]
MSKADQIAAYEKFKREARIQKILEFHEEAVKIDIELADKINGGSDTTFDANGHGEVHNGYDKAWVARLIAQHEQDMLKLRAKKEEERKQLVHDERNRMMAEIKKGGRSVGSAAASASTGAKKGWGVSSSSTAKPALKGNINTTTSTVTSSSSAFAAANRTPIAPSQKPRTPAAPSPGIGAGFMNLDELQNVFENVPDMGLDTAFQITQLLNSEDGTGGLYHDQQHDQEWGAPQLRHTPSTNDFTTTTSGPRKRTDSVSVLDESRFGTISAKNKQRRGTITVSTANTANESSNGGNGFWKPQAQPPSPEESEAMTDKFAKPLLAGGGGGGVGVGGEVLRLVWALVQLQRIKGTTMTIGSVGVQNPQLQSRLPTVYQKPLLRVVTQVEVEVHGRRRNLLRQQNPRRKQARQLWGDFRLYAVKARQGMQDRRNMALQDARREWQIKPGRSHQEREQQRENIMKLHERQHYLEMREEWQFNAGAGATSVGGGWETEQWSQEDDGRLTEPEEEEEEEEEEGPEEELIKPSPFNPRGLQYQQQQQPAQKKPSSLLTDMMAKGKNAVAGAVGAAIGMNAPSPAIPPPTTTSQARKFGAQASAAAIPTPPPITTSTTAGGKKAAAKKGRQTANKKVTPTSLMEPEDDSPEFESQPQLLTPRAAASSTKFTSSFGTSNNNNNSSSVFGFGSQTSRNAASASAAGGMWDDMISTTPKPASGLSNALGAGGGHSLGAGVRRPSGLHHQVWNAGEEREEEAEEGEQEEEEEEQEEEEEGEVEEDGWNMPGSLATRGGPFGVNAGIKKFGSTTTSNAKASPATKKNSPQPTMTTNAWGQWETTPSTASTTSSSKLTPTVSSAKVASTKKSALSRKNYHHQVTMEEIPDESDQLNRSPSNFLSPDSRIIMEPRPSKPPVVFDGIIQFGGESSSPEDTRHHQQHRPLPKPKGGKQRTMASSPLVNAGQGGEEIDEAWFQRAALQLQQGTEEGNKLFGGSGGSGGGGTPASSSSQAARNGINIPSRGPGGPTNKSNNPWSTTPSSFTSSSNQGVSMSGSFKDSSSLSGGPPPKSTSSLSSNTTSTTTTTSSSKSSLNNAWGSGLSSSPNTGTGLGFGKASNTKAKPTTSTSTGFGAGGFAWGSGSPSSFGNAGSNVDDNPWGGGGGGGGNGQSDDGWQEEKTEEELERERNLIDSKKRLQDLFGDSTTSSAAKPVPPKLATGGALKTAAARAKALREQQEREERERQEQMEREEEETREEEEREAREQAEREAQEKATKEKGAKEREVSAAAATKTKTGGVKKGKGRKR